VLALVNAAAPATGAPAAAERRGQAFWLGLARECKVPAGETAFGLVSEAVGLLGPPDTVWRDDIGYGVVASCVVQARSLAPGERQALVERLVANLGRGLGESGSDSVLLRSFSALDLSVFAAVELASPALDETGYRALLDAALAYLVDERDLRDLEPRVGWIHATAHTADLLEALARDRRLAPSDQRRMLDAAWTRMTAGEVPVFRRREDERLAAALAALVKRPDFDPALLDPWLARFPQLEKQVWAQAPPSPAVLDRAQNARHLLRSLYVALSVAAPDPDAAADSPRTAAGEVVRKKVRATIASIGG
jgi:hypothetical protein